MGFGMEETTSGPNPGCRRGCTKGNLQMALEGSASGGTQSLPHSKFPANPTEISSKSYCWETPHQAERERPTPSSSSQDVDDPEAHLYIYSTRPRAARSSHCPCLKKKKGLSATCNSPGEQGDVCVWCTHGCVVFSQLTHVRICLSLAFCSNVTLPGFITSHLLIN